MTIKAIETVYNGYRFRSRLEARWAVFFDALGIKYIYEKEGYELDGLGRYLPDFWIPRWETREEGDSDHDGIFVEIKPGEATKSEFDKIYKLAEQLETDAFIIQGSPWQNAYNIISIQFWDLGKLPYPIVQENLKFDYYSQVVSVDLNLYHQGIHLTGKYQDCGSLFSPRLVGIKRESQLLESAYAAAHQARFEFGESG